LASGRRWFPLPSKGEIVEIPHGLFLSLSASRVSLPLLGPGLCSSSLLSSPLRGQIHANDIMEDSRIGLHLENLIVEFDIVHLLVPDIIDS
jgi:hypothetical protein